MMTELRFVDLEEVESTNTWLRERLELGSGTVVRARRQSRGRGQRGNSWESEDGMNITMSMAYRPLSVAAAEQFALSRAVSLGIVDFLRRHVDGEVRIKWPNDIYVGDRKICGILIENTISGRSISRSVIGVGLNVNQRQFLSDAPNPVSIWQLTGRVSDVVALSAELAGDIVRRLEQMEQEPASTEGEYAGCLWRGKGFHRFRTPDGEEFDAAIEGVGPTGVMSLRHRDGSVTDHVFKSVVFVLRG